MEGVVGLLEVPAEEEPHQAAGEVVVDLSEGLVAEEHRQSTEQSMSSNQQVLVEQRDPGHSAACLGVRPFRELQELRHRNRHNHHSRHSHLVCQVLDVPVAADAMGPHQTKILDLVHNLDHSSCHLDCRFHCGYGYVPKEQGRQSDHQSDHR